MAEETFYLAVGLSRPPYVIQENNKGYEIELMTQVLAKMNRTASFIYVPYGRSPQMFDLKGIDAIMTTNKSVVKDETMLSDVYVTYQNVAVTLRVDNLKINDISELKNYTLASFQNADNVLGEEFKKATELSPLFMEVANQERQITLLLKRRVDSLIIDKNIFKYYANALGLTDLESTFTFHYVFPKTHYRVAFRYPKDVVSFNKALAEFSESVEHNRLIDKYSLR